MAYSTANIQRESWGFTSKTKETGDFVELTHTVNLRIFLTS